MSDILRRYPVALELVKMISMTMALQKGVLNKLNSVVMREQRSCGIFDGGISSDLGSSLCRVLLEVFVGDLQFNGQC